MAARMKVQVSSKVKLRLGLILLEGRWLFGERVASKLLEGFQRYMELLSQNPYMGPVEPLLLNRPGGYRGLCIHKHYKVIYRVEGNMIYVVDIWDTRQEPKRLVQGLKD